MKRGRGHGGRLRAKARPFLVLFGPAVRQKTREKIKMKTREKIKMHLDKGTANLI